MNKKKLVVTFPDQLTLYSRLIAVHADIELKGATLPYTSMHGNMFTFLSRDGDLNIRLPEEDRINFINKFKTQSSVQHGVIMKEYVLVPESLLKNTNELQIYFDKSVAYAKTLKAKPTTRRKS